MLPKWARLRRSDEYRFVMRNGSKAGRRRLVVHAFRDGSGGHPPKVGFVVSKAVGNSVVRHRVTRRLRHVMAERLGTLPEGSSLVIRALPAAASASSRELAKDTDSALRRLGLIPSRQAGNDDR
ncbi:ribonuclease P protein component [Haloechinothrix sp. LS1_15]|uniref:ribonuclease P protein component n=1 Tax=Haloechinothrix sp. LS1_15 TaxID=2652248 RepID=UPI0029453554|nr:ribonuclease P protein component [Haloechinothrix sp. LS1_15]MDV6010972.1 ribonuclease P protein component [Haloechinothrix sp. LS1_15]